MNDSKNFNQKPFRKIIDPKSGFSLYLKNFKDSSIYHISTEETFPIPDEIFNKNETTEFKKINLEIKKEIKNLKENQKILSKQSSNSIDALTKTNQQLTYIVYTVIALFIISVLF